MSATMPDNPRAFHMAAALVVQEIAKPALADETRRLFAVPGVYGEAEAIETVGRLLLDAAHGDHDDRRAAAVRAIRQLVGVVACGDVEAKEEGRG